MQQQPPAPPAAAIEDGLLPRHGYNNLRQGHYHDDPEDKGGKHRRRQARGRGLLRSSSSSLAWAAALATVLALGLVGGLAWRRLHGDAGSAVALEEGRGKAPSSFEGSSAKTLVQRGLEYSKQQQQPQQKEEEEEEQQPQQQPPAVTMEKDVREAPKDIMSWEERQASGRQVLATGVNVALQELMETRGHANASRVLTAEFEGAISFFARAAEIFSKTYDGKDEVIESDYFDAMELQALLRLHMGQCAHVDQLLDEAQRKIDVDSDERAAIALLRGYCEEGQNRAEKAGMYFSLAREYDPEGCHETLLDATYQPADYQLSAYLPPKADGHWPALLDLLVFRELYQHRARLSVEGTTWPGSLWARAPQAEDDPHGANVGWGMNEAGVARAAELVAANEFVILREFLHPFELAVLERYYKAKVAQGLQFDENLGRAVSYQDRVGMWLNHRMTNLIASVMDRPVKHAYSFLCHYEKRGDVVPALLAHTDREDNKYTTSIQIYSDKEEPLWPIYVDTQATLPEHSGWRSEPAKDQAIECGIRNGDALLFLGTRHTHFRPPMPAELSLVSSLLLHFVDTNFDFHDYKMRQKADPSI